MAFSEVLKMTLNFYDLRREKDAHITKALVNGYVCRLGRLDLSGYPGHLG